MSKNKKTNKSNNISIDSMLDYFFNQIIEDRIKYSIDDIGEMDSIAKELESDKDIEDRNIPDLINIRSELNLCYMVRRLKMENIDYSESYIKKLLDEGITKFTDIKKRVQTNNRKIKIKNILNGNS